LSDVLRSAGDNSTRVWAGSWYRHAPMVDSRPP
jgi:hypothetical protein